tara:strand:- start:751 stop:2259 length:1509 start_codon:yes stop_codon:yes gene_type:complete
MLSSIISTDSIFKKVFFGKPISLKIYFIILLSSLIVSLFSSVTHSRPAPKSFADLAEKLLPAVVNISSSQIVKPSQKPEMPKAPPGSPFEDFFKEWFDRYKKDGSPRRATSLGSGFIIDKTGYIVTNNHVIAGADEIVVNLQDGTRHEAKLLGRDSKTDLALLKIRTVKNLPFVSWGNSSTARVGDWVLAIGNPFGLGGTVTAGIISASKRNINQGPYDSFLQTDASINRGNSGGPMFNMDGKVIGVNTAIFSPSGGSVGVGFSIPSSIAKRVVAQLREFGRTKRGWLGVRIQSVTNEIAESLGLGEATGALVADVAADGPAKNSRMVPGDIILKFDGRTIAKMQDLPRIVAETKIGKRVKVEIWRNGGKKILEVVVGELREEKSARTNKVPAEKTTEPKETNIETLGLTLKQISRFMRQEYKIPNNIKGVLVTGVSDGSGASKKGITPGDVIVEVNQQEVNRPGQIAAIVSKAIRKGRQSVLLLINRGGNVRFIAVRLGKG